MNNSKKKLWTNHPYELEYIKSNSGIQIYREREK